MSKSIIPADAEFDFLSLTHAMRLFLYYYAQKPDIDWACKEAGIAKVTYTKTWMPQKRFREAWNSVVRGDVVDVIRAHAADQAGRSFERIIELRDQKQNLRVSLEAAKTSLRAVRDPTFASQLNVTKDIGANWRRVLMDLAPPIHALSQGDIIEAEDWKVLEKEPLLLEGGEMESGDS